MSSTGIRMEWEMGGLVGGRGVEEGNWKVRRG